MKKVSGNGDFLRMATATYLKEKITEAKSEAKKISARKAQELFKILKEVKNINLENRISLAKAIIEIILPDSRYKFVQNEIETLSSKLAKGQLQAAFAGAQQIDIAKLFITTHYTNNVPRVLNELLFYCKKGSLLPGELSDIFEQVQWQRLPQEIEDKYKTLLSSVLISQPSPE